MSTGCAALNASAAVNKSETRKNVVFCRLIVEAVVHRKISSLANQ